MVLKGWGESVQYSQHEKFKQVNLKDLVLYTIVICKLCLIQIIFLNVHICSQSAVLPQELLYFGYFGIKMLFAGYISTFFSWALKDQSSSQNITTDLIQPEVNPYNFLSLLFAGIFSITSYFRTQEVL